MLILLNASYTFIRLLDRRYLHNSHFCLSLFVASESCVYRHVFSLITTDVRQSHGQPVSEGLSSSPAKTGMLNRFENVYTEGQGREMRTRQAPVLIIRLLRHFNKLYT